MLAVQTAKLDRPTWPQRQISQSFDAAKSTRHLRFAAIGSEMAASLRVPTLDWPCNLFVDVAAPVDDGWIDGDVKSYAARCADDRGLSPRQAGSHVLAEANSGSVMWPPCLSCRTIPAEITT